MHRALCMSRAQIVTQCCILHKYFKLDAKLLRLAVRHISFICTAHANAIVNLEIMLNCANVHVSTGALNYPRYYALPVKYLKF